jgi:hypothetical protein
MIDALTPADLCAAGYRIEHGSEGDPWMVMEGLAGMYWWTFSRDTMMGTDVSSGEWPDPTGAIEDARANMAAEEAQKPAPSAGSPQTGAA